MIKSGKVFFNVSKPLESNETLNVRSSTMVAGVRGTSGYATVQEEETKMYLLEGNLDMTRIDPVTSKVETVQIKGGQVAASYKYEQKKENTADSRNDSIKKLENGKVTTILEAFSLKGGRTPAQPRGMVIKGKTLYIGDVFAEDLLSVKI